MGRIVAKVTVKNALDESKVRTFDALVDTGATLLTLPMAWKQDLGKFLNLDILFWSRLELRLIW